MPIAARYTLICDEVRIENTGKLIIIGLYGPDIQVPQFPWVLPSLTILEGLNVDQAGNYQFHGSLKHRDSNAEIAHVQGVIAISRHGFGFLPIRFGNLEISKEGAYVFVLNIVDQAESIMSGFDIVLRSAKEGGQ
jgi:hypothetical protein